MPLDWLKYLLYAAKAATGTEMSLPLWSSPPQAVWMECEVQLWFVLLEYI